MTLRMCEATCVQAKMIDKLMNCYMRITPVSPIASTNMPHGVTCGYETQHHTPGMTLTSMSPGIKSEHRRMCGDEQNWRFIDNYTSPPGMKVLRLYPHAKRIILEINWKRQATKTCFRLLRSLDGQGVQQQPEFRLAAQECELSSRFFRGKIDNLLSGLQYFNDIDRPSDEIRCLADCIDVFDRTTNTEITAICSATKKTCMLDPLPANQLTDNITGIVPAITRITNTSLDEGVMPKSLKHAILKKPSLDKDTLSSYQPVSNLTQLSRIIEKVVALRIMTRVSDQKMVECFQSAYREKTFDRNCAVVCYKCRQNSNGQKTRNHLASRGFHFRLRYDQP